jgi:DNA-binding NtrC family response regulator
MTSLRVLIHGWNQEFHSTVIERMTAKDWSVFQCETDEDLVTLLTNQDIDVAILDLCAAPNPGMNRIDIIKSIQSSAQVICITPADKVGLSIDVMRHGAFADLQCPYTWTKLLKTIQAAGKQKQKHAPKTGKKGFWKNVGDHLYAGSLAEAGAPDLARKWMDQESEKDKKKNK